MHSSAIPIDANLVRRSNKIVASERDREAERKPFMRAMSLRRTLGGFSTNPASSSTVLYTRKNLAREGPSAGVGAQVGAAQP